MPADEQDQYPGDELRILHWNIHSWRDVSGASNLEAVIQLVRETDPHIVSLVEVDEPWGTSACVSELASRCGYSWFFTPVFEFGQDTPRGGFGNALLTKLPILAVQQWQLVWPPTLYDGTEPSEPRAVVFAKLGSVWVGSTHLPRGDAGARTAALQRLATLTQGLDDHWLLCGDFNTLASSWLNSDCGHTVCPDPPQPTYPAGEPTEAIDYCIASPGISMEAKVLAVGGSDHLPVLVLARLGSA